MKRYIALVIFSLLPVVAVAQTSSCERAGLYSFSLYGCSNYESNFDPTVPLCQREGYKHLAYLDSRCFIEIPFDYSKPCYGWECPEPYVHILVEPISGRTKTVLGDADEIRNHFKSCRASAEPPKKVAAKKKSKR